MSNAECNKFFIILPLDKWGNTNYGHTDHSDTATPCIVVEASVIKGKYDIWLEIVNPSIEIFPWVLITGRIGNAFGCSYMEVDGPARKISREEWVELIRENGDEQLVKIVGQFG